MVKRTPLYKKHLASNGKMVDFAGWEMPIHYGSQIDEHHQVRNAAGMFDVSHMTVCDFRGADVKPFLHKLLANNIDKLKDNGKALYSCMLDDNGGVIDDLIVYYMDDQWFRVVVNAATREKDLAWMQRQAKAFAVTIEERSELAMIAVQGPEARDRVHQVLGKNAEAVQQLKPFFAANLVDYFIARTGYTGEDGYEIIVSENTCEDLWDKLLAADVKPIGLGARDTLRLEAGMNLYGQDMDETTSPLESGLGWTIGWEPADRAFNGRKVLEQQRSEGVTRKLVGLVLLDRGVMRSHQKVVLDDGSEGETTSGSYSPTLEQSIAFARVPVQAKDTCKVEIRGKLFNAKIVKPPFVRNGKSCLE